MPDDLMSLPMHYSKDAMATTTPQEIMEAQPDIEKWKQEKHLPTNYGKIIEDERYWTILKRTEYPLVMGLPFRNVMFGLSGDPKTKRLYIHSIQYPKSDYTRDWIEKMSYLTTNCPYCMDGTQFIELPALSKFLNSNSITEIRSEGTTMFDRLFDRVGLSKGNVSGADIGANLIVSGMLGNAIDAATGGDQTLRRDWKLGIGIISSIGAALFGMHPVLGRHKTILKHTTLMGWNMIFAAVDISPSEMKDWQRGVKTAWSQMLGYGPVQGLKALFVKSKYGGPATGPKELIPFGNKYPMPMATDGGFVPPIGTTKQAASSPLMVRRLQFQ